MRVLAILLLAALVGCGTPGKQTVGAPPSPREPPDDRSSYKVGTPYRISGRTYYPKAVDRHVETGTASWYGRRFHGRRTANGETFNMYAMTAAHRTLPMPSVVRVTRLDNGRSVVVRVNDRGPFKDNRIVDLSLRAAEKLGIRRRGIAKVRVELLPGPSRSVARIAKSRGGASAQDRLVGRLVSFSGAAASGSAIYYVQAGAFRARASADRMADGLKRRLDGVHIIPSRKADGRVIYRVRVGPVGSRGEAESLRSQVRRAGPRDAFVVTSKG